MRRAMFLLLVLWAMGCSSGSSYRSATAPQAFQGPANLGGYAGGLERGDSVRLASLDAAPTSRRRYSKASSGPAKAKAPASANGQSTIQRRLIRNAALTLEVPDHVDYKPTLIKIRKIVESMEGYIQAETTQTMTLMIPTNELDAALAKLTALGKVLARDVSVVDVTARYVDMQIRIDNLRRLRVRLTELIAQSDDVSEILKIEKELARTTSQLERMEGQFRVLNKQTTFATIRVRLEERVSPGPVGWLFYGVGMGIKWLFVWD